MEPLLQNNNAVARIFVRKEIRIFLAGRTLPRLDVVVGGIRSSGRLHEAAGVDAFDGRGGEENASA